MIKTELPPALLKDLQKIKMMCEEEGLPISLDEIIGLCLHYFKKGIEDNLENGLTDEEIVFLIDDWLCEYLESY